MIAVLRTPGAAVALLVVGRDLLGGFVAGERARDPIILFEPVSEIHHPAAIAAERKRLGIRRNRLPARRAEEGLVYGHGSIRTGDSSDDEARGARPAPARFPAGPVQSFDGGFDPFDFEDDLELAEVEASEEPEDPDPPDEDEPVDAPAVEEEFEDPAAGFPSDPFAEDSDDEPPLSAFAFAL
jgi:hypothetical protein